MRDPQRFDRIMEQVFKTRGYGKVKMRDPQRIDRILNLIAVVWRRNPDLRLGQLLININGSSFERSGYAFEDDDVEKNLTEFVMRINRKEESNT